MENFKNITQPTLLLDENKVRKNIKRMAQKASSLGVMFRPHFKTHQSQEIGHWFRDEGVVAITVSSIKMANYFAEDGWNDISIAFPVNLREIEAINTLSSKVKINLLIDNLLVINELDSLLEQPVDVLLKIDAGYGRAGIQSQDIDQIGKLIRQIKNSAMLSWKGFLAHNGLTYQSKSIEEVLEYHLNFITEMDRIAGIFLPLEPNQILSIGDTPACSLASSIGTANEIRPGNFVFYDVMQNIIGSCTFDDIAVVLACPVISVYPHRNEVLIYGGAIHLSKESAKMDGENIFGIPVQLTENGWEQFQGKNVVKSLSQEHGIIHFEKDVFSTIKPGMLIGILPVHSCLTAHAMRSYINRNGKKISMMN